MNDSRFTNIENPAAEGSASEAKNICRSCEFPLLESGECASCSFRTELDFIERHRAGDCVSVILTGARQPALYRREMVLDARCELRRNDGV